MVKHIILASLLWMILAFTFASKGNGNDSFLILFTNSLFLRDAIYILINGHKNNSNDCKTYNSCKLALFVYIV